VNLVFTIYRNIVILVGGTAYHRSEQLMGDERVMCAGVGKSSFVEIFEFDRLLVVLTIARVKV
jgi:hypothetical protein